MDQGNAARSMHEISCLWKTGAYYAGIAGRALVAGGDDVILRWPPSKAELGETLLGAPWAWCGMRRPGGCAQIACRCGGNGGLSLRDPHLMRAVGVRYPPGSPARNARSGPAARGFLFTNPLVRFPAPHHGRRLAFSGVRRLRSGIEVNLPSLAALARNARSGPAARDLLFTNPLVRFPAPHHGRRLAFSGVRRWRSGIEANSARLATFARDARSAPGSLL